MSNRTQNKKEFYPPDKLVKLLEDERKQTGMPLSIIVVTRLLNSYKLEEKQQEIKS